MADGLIRSATPKDLPGLLALYRHLKPGDQDASVMAPILERICASDDLDILVLERDGALLASCYLNITPNLTHSGKPYALIENVVSDPAYRRQGLARAVLKRTETIARARGCYKIMLMTGRADLVPFYEACGYAAGQKHGMQIRF